MKAKSTIERLKTQITKLTEASVKGVIDLRLSRGSFYDDSYKSNRKTFMQTCEGLEIILIPVVTIRSQILLQAINKNEVKKSIENDINYLINSVNKQSYQFFSGSPYYEIGKKPKIAKNSIDALGFYTNVLVHLYELINKQVIKSTTLTKGYVEGHLLKCVEALINCCGTMGWSFYIDNQTIPDEYPTWSILETVADIQTYFPLGYKKIEESGILKKVEDWLIGRTKNGAIKELHEFISSFPPDIDIHNPTVSSRAKCFYDVCHLLSGLAILDSAGDIKLGHNINYLLIL